MARNRQRAKQRQAERRARLEGGDGRTGEGHRRDGEGADPDLAEGAPPEATGRPDPVLEPGIASGAPPENIGRSDALFGGPHDEPEGIPSADELDDEEAEELEAEAESEPLEAPLDPSHPDRAGHVPEPGPPGRNRLIVFLVGCWNELGRVQWPSRSQLFTLTGVVLGFVIIAGGYLGLLDFVFNRLIRTLLLS